MGEESGVRITQKRKHKHMSQKDLGHHAGEEATPKVFQLLPEDWELLRKIRRDDGLRRLLAAVKGLDLPDPDKRQKRPIRLLFPPELHKELAAVAKRAGMSLIDVLLAAARQYRNEHPIPADWQDPDPQVYEQIERARREREKDLSLSRMSLVVRLLPDDRSLLQDLGRGRSDIHTRHQAFLELQKILPTLQFENVSSQNTGSSKRAGKPKRKPLRLVIPRQLDETIEAHVAKGHSYVSVLIAAAREYERQQNE